MSSDVISVEPFPSYRQEVERKAWETFYTLAKRHRDNEITNVEFKSGIDTLQMALSGMVNDDFMRLLSEAKKEIKGQATEVDLFHRPYIDESLVLALRKPSQAKVEVITIEQGKSPFVRVKNFNDTEKPSAESLKYINKLKAKLLQSGFELF